MRYGWILLAILLPAHSTFAEVGCETALRDTRKIFLSELARGQRMPEDAINFLIHPKRLVTVGYFSEWKAGLARALDLPPTAIEARFKHVADVERDLLERPSVADEIRLLIVRMPPTIYYFPVVGFSSVDHSLVILRTDAGNYRQITGFGRDASLGWKIFPRDSVFPARGQVLGMLRLRVPGMAL